MRTTNEAEGEMLDHTQSPNPTIGVARPRCRRDGRPRRLAVALLVVVTGFLGLAATPAHAVFPGANGPIFYVCQTESSQGLCRLDPDTLTVTLLFHDPFTNVRGSPGASPDGSTVAFGWIFGISTVPAAGGPMSHVEGTKLPDQGVSYTPDGASVVYGCVFGPAGPGLCRAPVAGGGAVRIPGTRDGDSEPEVSPDGTMVAFVHGDTLYTIPLTGGQRMPLTSGILGYQVSWSPDGSHIAFTAGSSGCRKAGHGRTATIAATGGPVTCLPNSLNGDVSASWSPDGTQIFVTSNGHAVFLGANGVGRQVTPVTGVGANDWAPLLLTANARCAALDEQLRRATEPAARQFILVFLVASGCPVA